VVSLSKDFGFPKYLFYENLQRDKCPLPTAKMDTEFDQNLEQITREYVDFLDDVVSIVKIYCL